METGGLFIQDQDALIFVSPLLPGCASAYAQGGIQRASIPLSVDGALEAAANDFSKSLNQVKIQPCFPFVLSSTSSPHPSPSPAHHHLQLPPELLLLAASRSVGS